MSDTKFCKDCRFYSWEGDYAVYDKCMKTVTRDLVRGKEHADSCMSMRSFGEHCGPDAKWFEPREPEQVAA